MILRPTDDGRFAEVAEPPGSRRVLWGSRPVRNNRDAESLATTQEAPQPAHWHGLSIPAVLTAAQTGTTGLSDAAAAARLAEFGPNRLQSAKPISAARILRDQLSSVVVFLLAVAAAISAALEDYLEVLAIATVLLINTVIGFATE